MGISEVIGPIEVGVISISYCMVCASVPQGLEILDGIEGHQTKRASIHNFKHLLSVRGDNPRALASGLSPVQMHNQNCTACI